jgi:hypothetical protein
MATDIGNVIQKLYEDSPNPPKILLMGEWVQVEVSTS